MLYLALLKEETVPKPSIPSKMEKTREKDTHAIMIKPPVAIPSMEHSSEHISNPGQS
jgi:hypothetical protein